jgi:hypothetical protein
MRLEFSELSDGMLSRADSPISFAAKWRRRMTGALQL